MKKITHDCVCIYIYIYIYEGRLLHQHHICCWWILLPMGSKHFNTNERIWTSRETILKNKPNLVAFYESKLVIPRTFQLTLLIYNIWPPPTKKIEKTWLSFIIATNFHKASLLQNVISKRLIILGYQIKEKIFSEISYFLLFLKFFFQKIMTFATTKGTLTTQIKENNHFLCAFKP